MTRLLLCAAALLATPLVAPPALAQDDEGLKPIAVISMAGIEELLADFGYLSDAAGLPEMSGLTETAGPFLRGIDPKRPFGLMVLAGNGTPKGIAFLPVTDFDRVLEQLETFLGPAGDVGGGVQKFTLGQTVYFKHQGDWVFISDTANHLAKLPRDPGVVLDGLDETYDIAARVLLTNLPQNLRELLTGEIKALIMLNAPEDEDPLERRIREGNITSIMTLIEGTEEVALGVAVDRVERTTFLELKTTAIEGTRLAQQMRLLNGNQSAFNGFLLPEAAATFQVSDKIPSEDIDQMTAMIAVAREKLMEGIDEDSGVPEELRGGFKEVVGELMDVLDETVENGKFDVGGAILLEPDSITFAAGGLVSNGAVVEAQFKKLIDLVKDQPDVPEVHFNADQHRDVRLHTFSLPIPEQEEDARKLLGENLAVVVGTGDKSVYIAMGKDGIGMLKQIIDKSVADADRPVPPIQMSIALLPFVKYLRRVDDDNNFDALARTLQQLPGQDHIMLSAKPIERGVVYRIEFEEGVLKMVGQSIKQNRRGG